jgi:hypothetical protein
MKESAQLTGESVQASSTHPAPKISPNALKVLKKRYLSKDELGAVVETRRAEYRAGRTSLWGGRPTG